MEISLYSTNNNEITFAQYNPAWYIDNNFAKAILEAIREDIKKIIKEELEKRDALKLMGYDK